LKNLTRGFAAVRLIRASGWKFLPGPDFGGPESMFQDEGASTARTGILVVSMASITLGKGSRTSPEKEKPGLVSLFQTQRGDVDTEDGIDDQICPVERGEEVVCEWYV
jgi:hypothetical protein